MTRDEFLGRLGELLACLPAEQVEETRQFYAEAIADRMEDGMSEEEAVAAMGRARRGGRGHARRPARRARARSPGRAGAAPRFLWTLTVVGSPVWVPLLIAFVAVALSVYVCIWVLALCVWLVAAALGGMGVAELLFAAGGVAIGARPLRPRLGGRGARPHRRGAPRGGRAPGRPPSRSRASRRSGRERPSRPSGRTGADQGDEGAAAHLAA